MERQRIKIIVCVVCLYTADADKYVCLCEEKEIYTLLKVYVYFG